MNRPPKNKKQEPETIPIQIQINRIPFDDLLAYEIHSSCLVKKLVWAWQQKLASIWFSWKTKKKYTRYTLSLIAEANADKEESEK